MATAPALPRLPELEDMPAEQLIRWAYVEFGQKLCLTCSWQKQSSVLVHMVSELGLPIEVIELDTQLFFKESYETREALGERYGLTLIRPEVLTIAEQHKREGPNLWESNPDRCCHLRKVEPLIRALEPYGAWISGIRRDQSPSRASTPKVEWSERYGVWKIHPLADWDESRVWAYIKVNEIPYNPATARSAASRARGRRLPRKKSAPAAGPAPTSWNAAFTSRLP
jgi:phosphoadenosine phosphosulfate reductase